MGLKEIELVTLEAMKEVAKEEFGDDFDVDAPVDPDDMRFMVKVMTRFLARVDQERGKDAICYLYRDMTSGGKNGVFKVCQVTPCDDAFPVFLSPTIPAGYALVPIQPTQEMCEQAYYEFNAERKDFDAANLYRAMIKAAQEGVTK